MEKRRNYSYKWYRTVLQSQYTLTINTCSTQSYSPSIHWSLIPVQCKLKAHIPWNDIYLHFRMRLIDTHYRRWSHTWIWLRWAFRPCNWFRFGLLLHEGLPINICLLNFPLFTFTAFFVNRLAVGHLDPSIFPFILCFPKWMQP